MASRCWICNEDCSGYVLLPEIEDEFNLPRDWRTYFVKRVNTFKFLYYIVCYTCMDGYLSYFPVPFTKLHRREIGLKNQNSISRRCRESN